MLRRSPMPPRTTRLRLVPLRRFTVLQGGDEAQKDGRPTLETAGPRRRTPLTHRPFRSMPNRRWPEVRRAVYERAQGHCDMCGFMLAEQWECHHRKLRSQGGRDLPSNLLALGLECHGRAHANPAVARSHGWIVSREHDPSVVPVRMVDGRFLLDDEGGRRPAPDGGGDDAA